MSRPVHLVRRFLRLFCLSLLLAFGMPAGAMERGIAFASLANGDVIDPQAISDDVIAVDLVIGYEPGDDPDDFRVYVSSSEVRVAPGTIDVVEVGIGPTRPQWMIDAGTPWGDIYYGNLLANPELPLVPLVAVLAYVPQADPALAEIVGVDRVVLYDGRFVREVANPAELDAVGGAVPGGPLVTQLSATGLARLGPTHAEPLPWASIADFNAQMRRDIDTVMTERSQALDRVCLPLPVQDAFTATPQWGLVLADALAAYGAWEAADRTCKAFGVAGCGVLAGLDAVACTIACTAAQSACVDELPARNDFEICFDSLDGMFVDQTVRDLDRIALGYSTNAEATIEANVVFDRLRGTVDVRLADFELRYRRGAEDCFPRPVRQVPESSVRSEPTLDAWSLCAGNVLQAERVCSDCTPDFPVLPPGVNPPFPEPFLLAPDPVDPERLAVDDDGATGLLLQGLEIELGDGTCTDIDANGFDADIRPAMEELVAAFYPDALDLVDRTWNEPDGAKGHDDHLEDLLLPFSTGLETPADYDPDIRVGAVLSRTVAPAPAPGLALQHEVAVSDISGSGVAPTILNNGDPGAEFVNPPEYPEYADLPFWADGLTPARLPQGARPYDFHFTLNTGYLNKILAATYRDAFTMTLLPTWDQLGLPPAPGQTGSDRPALTVAILEQWLGSAFGALGAGSDPVALSLRPDPVRAPFTYMPSDAGGLRARLTFHAPQLVLSIVHDGEPRLAFHVDQFDNEISFGFDSAGGGSSLAFAADPNAIWNVVLVDSQLSGCSVDSQWNPTLPAPGCGELASAALSKLLPEVLDPVRDALLGSVAAPQYFDQAGTSALPLRALGLDVAQAEGYVTLFARFEDVALPDMDADGIVDDRDNCRVIPNPDQSDVDADGIGDACDGDNDNDGIDDAQDNCELIANPVQGDIDADGLGDRCDPDADNDGVEDEQDNCPLEFNPAQTNIDEDDQGDACDDDTDNDGIADTADNCPLEINPGQADFDGDGAGDACDVDLDGDGINDADDLCPYLRDADRVDADGDGIGDACDDDADNDGIADASDSCPLRWNPMDPATGEQLAIDCGVRRLPVVSPPGFVIAALTLVALGAWLRRSTRSSWHSPTPFGAPARTRRARAGRRTTGS